MRPQLRPQCPKSDPNAAGAKIYTFGGLGVFGIPTFINNATKDISSMVWALIAVGVAVVIAFVATFVTYRDEEKKTEDLSALAHKTSIRGMIASPLKGEVVELNKVEDEAFSTEVLGKGVAILPVEGKLIAPVDGEVLSLFPTGHAIGLKTDFGAEILIHIGTDTVKLEGKFFTQKVKIGEKIKKGQTLIEFDIEGIKKAGYSVVTPVIVTNTEEYSDIISESEKNIDYGQDLLTLI